MRGSTRKNTRASLDCGEALRLSYNYADAYAGLALASIHKTNYANAFTMYGEAIRLDRKFPETYLNRGVLGFYFGSHSNLQADLGMAVKLEPGNVYNSIWLDLARRREGLPSILGDAPLDISKWPAPIVRLLMGDLTADAVLDAAGDPDETTRKAQVCEANFYTAEFQRLRHRDEEALRLYRLALRDCPRDFIEYTAAIMALRSSGHAP